MGSRSKLQLPDDVVGELTQALPDLAVTPRRKAHHVDTEEEGRAGAFGVVMGGLCGLDVTSPVPLVFNAQLNR